MQIFDYYVITIIGMISSYVHLLCYELLSDGKKIKYNLKLILSLLVCGIILMINTYFNIVGSRLIVSVLVLFFLDYYLFREDYTVVTVKCIISYVALIIAEVLLLVFMVIFKLNLEYIDANIWLKGIMSFANSLLFYLICSLKIVKSFCKKIIVLIKKDIMVIILFILSLTFFGITIYMFVSNISSSQYIGLLSISICFFVLCFLSLLNSLKVYKEIEKTEVILRMITKYEKIIEENRVNRHEMLNNILIIKSYKNKNSKECNDYISELTNIYEGNKNGMVKNIYKLPPGLKGIIYYKLKDADTLKLNVTVTISKKMSDFINKSNNKDYVALCKVFAILIDNAIEATKESVEKLLIVDMHENDEKITIEICNTFSNKVDLNKVGTVNYSTKGKKRGLGLYIANSIIKDSNVISLHRKIDNDLFVSVIEIKK